MGISVAPMALRKDAVTERDLLSFIPVRSAVLVSMGSPPTFAALARLSAMEVIGPGLLNSGSDATTSAETKMSWAMFRMLMGCPLDTSPTFARVSLSVCVTISSLQSFSHRTDRTSDDLPVLTTTALLLDDRNFLIVSTSDPSPVMSFMNASRSDP